MENCICIDMYTSTGQTHVKHFVKPSVAVTVCQQGRGDGTQCNEAYLSIVAQIHIARFDF